MSETHPPILVLHGYEVYENGRLGPLASAVCETAMPILWNNPSVFALLLGGWHLKEAGPETTIGEAMKDQMVRNGISPDRLLTKKDFPYSSDYMPPRDSWEEVIFLKQIVMRRGIGRDDPINFIACDFHIPRLRNIYRTYGLTNAWGTAAIPQPHEGLGRRKRIEQIARIVRFIDPYGYGIICHGTRLKRTLNENLKPLIPQRGPPLPTVPDRGFFVGYSPIL